MKDFEWDWAVEPVKSSPENIESTAILHTEQKTASLNTTWDLAPE